MPKKRKIFYGWWIVLASTILNVLNGGTFVYGFTVFFNPIRETFGWTAVVTSVAFLFQRLEQGMLSPLAGFLVDRVGPRKLMLGGWVIVGLGFLGMSRIHSLWAFYAAFLIIATGFSFGSFVTMNTAVANWFTKKRSRAMTLLYVGFGISGALVPLVALSISQFGWRETLVFISIASWLIGIPLSLVMRHKPGQYGYLPDGEIPEPLPEPGNEPVLHQSSGIDKQDSGSSTPNLTAREALRTRAFWLLSFSFGFQHIATTAIMVHIVPYLESVKIPTTIAATAVTGMTLCSLIGRLGFGILGDFTNKRYLIAIALTLQAIGTFIFSFAGMDKVWFVILFLFLYAPGFGGTIPLKPALQADYFGTRSFGTILGLMSIVNMVTGIAGPVIAGWIFDVTGSYRFAWRIFALATMPAIPLILLAMPPRVKQD